MAERGVRGEVCKAWGMGHFSRIEACLPMAGMAATLVPVCLFPFVGPMPPRAQAPGRPARARYSDNNLISLYIAFDRDRRRLA
ncbi:MAG TPA: hypothetical protein VMU82_00100, partial [Acetobacteraceae bacterium]|nr:hypothetical protein [Acetobacteraceae bacterium]